MKQYLELYVLWQQTPLPIHCDLSCRKLLQIHVLIFTVTVVEFVTD